MRKILLIAFFLLSVSVIFAQNYSNNSTNVVKKSTVAAPDKMPEFPGGVKAGLIFLSHNIHYPKDAQQAKKEGRVIIQFVVDKDGSITDAEVVKKVYPSLDNEALRVVNMMPKWIPAYQKGKPVKVKYIIPVTFNLKNGVMKNKDYSKCTDAYENML